VKTVNEVPMGEQAAAMVIASDDKRAFVCLNLASKVAVLNIDSKAAPATRRWILWQDSNLITLRSCPLAKLSLSSATGGVTSNGGAEVTIDPSGPYLRVVALMPPGNRPEGFVISPYDKWAAAPLPKGSGAQEGDWFYTNG
jgi:hypothetical protein